MTLGIVMNIDPHLGLLVKLPFAATGTIAMTDLTDCYVKDPLKVFSKDQMIRWVVDSVSHQDLLFC